jgi:hypothetical protein
VRAVSACDSVEIVTAEVAVAEDRDQADVARTLRPLDKIDNVG